MPQDSPISTHWPTALNITTWLHWNEFISDGVETTVNNLQNSKLSRSGHALDLQHSRLCLFGAGLINNIILTFIGVIPTGLPIHHLTGLKHFSLFFTIGEVTPSQSNFFTLLFPTAALEWFILVQLHTMKSIKIYSSSFYILYATINNLSSNFNLRAAWIFHSSGNYH